MAIRIRRRRIERGNQKGEEGKVRSVWLRHPIPSNKVTKEGKHLTQHIYTKRGIEQVSLLEAASEEKKEEEDKKDEDEE